MLSEYAYMLVFPPDPLSFPRAWTGSSCFWCRTGVILVSCVFHTTVCAL